MSSQCAPVASETSIMIAIMDRLRWAGYGVWRQNTGGRRNRSGQYVQFNPPGWPDVQAIKAGHSVFVEVKRPGEKPRPEQLEMHAELRHYGATVIVATSVDDVAAALGLPAFAA